MAGATGLYVHWPFCAAKCPYCDFNSHVAERIDQARWQAAYLAEIARAAQQTGPRILSSIFFGGGTPSLMAPETVAGVIAAARQAWGFTNSVEITLEANPTSVEAGRFAAYREAGVNRISMGVQSLRDDDLRRLGRLHTAAEARAAFDVARGLFDRVSFDLIYARQDQSLADWEAELREALAMAVDHLSLYQLTIEPGTAFGDRLARSGLRGLPGEDLGADLYERTQDICGAAGLVAYEVSNHARPGAESRHNLIYWEGGDWIGVGPGAHGRLTQGTDRIATEAVRSPMAWLAATKAGAGVETRERLTNAQAADEYLLMGLRLSRGVSLPRMLRQWGLRADPAPLTMLEQEGFITRFAERLAATARGRMLLNSLIPAVAQAFTPESGQSGT